MRIRGLRNLNFFDIFIFELYRTLILLLYIFITIQKKDSIPKESSGVNNGTHRPDIIAVGPRGDIIPYFFPHQPHSDLFCSSLTLVQLFRGLYILYIIRFLLGPRPLLLRFP